MMQALIQKNQKTTEEMASYELAPDATIHDLSVIMKMIMDRIEETDFFASQRADILTMRYRAIRIIMRLNEVRAIGNSTGETQ